ncbi:transcription antitermination factor NusB, putative [Synechococcus sp. PCC 7335]|uniref:transcription antitermination factor NusB n=1 Tax=Synechococcus sp. (strain ATCC 29403 / PCC 7335) TaxID=91464 RepID=UPI00017ED610|nr:transcription antitermination factor NusB [Synechococcus sp. PCC 7335]EDX85711.1 transcription antitermination factor NusB, putative [Synechococcus sp. PCC 7335]
MKARSIARELALLGVSQLTDNLSRRQTSISVAADYSKKQLDGLLLKALTALGADAKEGIETAEGELQRGERLILESETRTIDLKEARSRIQSSIPLTKTAINQVGEKLELLMFSQQTSKEMTAVRKSLESAAKSVEAADQLLREHQQKVADIETVRSQIQSAIITAKLTITKIKTTLEPEQLVALLSRDDIRGYACELLGNWISYQKAIDAQLNEAMEKWSIRRLARVDRDILRLAMIEIVYMDVPKKVAIDEAIEMAKRYSDEDGYRFINGVLRRTTDKL